eukprot:TRINITY_DN4492_c0_g1_i1.p1 TRINITY_DN4492_c0_g1~~TRINITY_DN4492_c0_g1_i1.p1  ORF type:complete len:354 (+),score=95.81 TRINITY_DN4492_c0_g1_i1:133-1194(+)
MGYCQHFDDNDTRSVWIASLVASFFSLFGSSFMLNSFFTFGKRNKGTSSLVALLALSDFGWSLSASSSLIIILDSYETLTLADCMTMRFLFQFFSGSCVLWCVCISWFLNHSVGKSAQASSQGLSIVELKSLFNTVTPKMWACFFCISYGIPVLFICILLGGHHYKHSSNLVMCYPEPIYHVLFWFLPNILAIVFQMVCLVMIVRRTNYLRKILVERYPLFKPQRESLPVQLRVALYAVVFLVCWSMDILYWTLHYINGADCQNYPLFFIYNTLINSHGLLDAIVYGITNSAIRDRYSQRPIMAIFMALFSPFVLPFTFSMWVYRIIGNKEEDLREHTSIRKNSKLSLIHSVG